MGLSSDKDREAALVAFVAGETGAEALEIAAMERLGGGAIQENYALDLTVTGGAHAGQQALVLRTDAPSSVSMSLSRVQEFAVMRAAYAAGVAVPEPLWLCEDPDVIGQPFYIMRRATGTAAGRAVARSELSEDARDALVERLGVELARLHAVRAPADALAFLPEADAPPACSRVAELRAQLDTLPDAHPALEWGLAWLERHAPSAVQPVLCHGDYRTGNYMVDDGALTGILDWEFAHWGDPLEDLGWFCARCWRFGNVEREAGGVGSRQSLYRGYERVAGQAVDAERVPYWEVLASVRWAVVALLQGQRHLSGQQSSLELALTRRMAPEMALDMLMQIEQIEAGARMHA